MNDDTARKRIEPDDLDDRTQRNQRTQRVQMEHERGISGASETAGKSETLGTFKTSNAFAHRGEALTDRGMPALGAYGSARPPAWWLTPLLVILMACGGAVWTIHAFLARHDAQAKARRDAVAQTPAQGRVFKDEPLAASAISASPAIGASVPIWEFAPAPAMVRSPASLQHRAARSRYDAPLLATGSVSAAAEPSGATLEPGAPMAQTDSNHVAEAAPLFTVAQSRRTADVARQSGRQSAHQSSPKRCAPPRRHALKPACWATAASRSRKARRSIA
jgi:hypothetical protein